MLESFKPIVDENSKILVLGSMPGEESLRQNQYYAFKRNQFWDIIYKVFDSEKSDEYEEKVKFLRENKIALWDVIYKCNREGSLDSNIKDEIPNDILNLLDKYPNINYILFNGGKAEKSFKKHFGFKLPYNIEFYRMPSTSPAYTIKLKEKLKDWMIIKTLL